MTPALLARLVRDRRYREAQALIGGWLDPDPATVRREQLERLRAVWADASRSVPYYRDLVASGTVPATFRTIEEFTDRMPVLTRETLAAAPDRFHRDGRAPDGYSMTAGSTGTPLRFGYERGEGEAPARNLLAGRIANGMAPDDRAFLLWGHSHLLGTGLRGWRRHAVRKAKDWAMGYRRSDAYHLDLESARAHLRALVAFRPKVVIGYSSALDLLVRQNAAAAPRARRLGVKFVVATAEVLPRADTRAVIEHFFGCRLVMEYGGVEFGAIAYTRPGSTRYGVFWWDCLAEALQDRGAAQPVLVTTLAPRYLPLIRYRTGDEVCGPERLPGGAMVGFEELHGRHNDVVRLEDGSLVHSVGLFHCIHQESSILNIQLLLEDDGPRLLLVSGQADTAAIDRIRHRLGDLNPRLASCRVELVPDVVTNRAGKRRWIVDRRTARG